MNHIKIVEIRSMYYVCLLSVKRLLNLLQLDAVFLEQLPDDEVHVGAAHDEAEHDPDQKP